MNLEKYTIEFNTPMSRCPAKDRATPTAEKNEALRQILEQFEKRMEVLEIPYEWVLRLKLISVGIIKVDPERIVEIEKFPGVKRIYPYRELNLEIL